MTLADRAQAVFQKLDAAQWLPQLLVRLFLGYFFFLTGIGHLKNLDRVTGYFASLEIPMPAFNAILSSYTELIGGALVMVGLGTRLVSFPLFINMVVATLAAKLKKLAGLGDFVELSEPLYALVFLWLVFSGPGMVSLDHVVAKVLRRQQGSAQRAPMTAS